MDSTDPGGRQNAVTLCNSIRGVKICRQEDARSSGPVQFRQTRTYCFVQCTENSHFSFWRLFKHATPFRRLSEPRVSNHMMVWLRSSDGIRSLYEWRTESFQIVKCEMGKCGIDTVGWIMWDSIVHSEAFPKGYQFNLQPGIIDRCDFSQHVNQSFFIALFVLQDVTAEGEKCHQIAFLISKRQHVHWAKTVAWSHTVRSPS
jgi:hypothetical protein